MAELLLITEKPTNNNLEHLQETINIILQAVELPGGTDAIGLITTKSNYHTAHARATFDRLNMVLKVYNPSIESNGTTTNSMCEKRGWTANLLQQSLLQASKCGSHTLILGVFKDTPVRH